MCNRRFNASLICGPQPDKADIALQLNPRFDVEWVVRNSKIKKHWGTEEAAATTAFPFRDSEPFQIEIFTSPSSYLVSKPWPHLNFIRSLILNLCRVEGLNRYQFVWNCS